MMSSIPLPVFVVMVLFLLAMAGILAFAGVRARRRGALVAATPTTPIGMATDGYREFEGRCEAVPGEPVEAALTRWPCVWFEARVEEFKSRRDSGEWTTVEQITSSAPFIVRDGTGVCVVDPHLAEVTPTDKSRWYGATKVPTDRDPAKVGPTKSAGGVEFASTATAKFRYTEARIYAGDPLLVLGEFTTGRFTAAGGDDDGFDEEPEASADADEREMAAELARADRIWDAAHAVTRATISRGTGTQPFLFTTTPQADHVAMSAVGGSAAIGIALLPLAIVALMIWMRFF